MSSRFYGQCLRLFYSSLAYKPAACWLCSLQCLVIDTLELGVAPFAVAVVETTRNRLSLSRSLLNLGCTFVSRDGLLL